MAFERALLIVPPTGKYIREDRCQTPIKDFATIALRPPIDLMYVGAMLEREGVACRLRDYPGEERSWADLEAELRDFQPELVVMSCTTPSLDEDMKAAALAKAVIGPEVLTIAKGAHFKHRDEDALARYPQLDIALRGEYEFTMAEIGAGRDLVTVSGITYRAHGEVRRNPDRGFQMDLDQIPFPARHLANNALYIRPDTGERQTTIITNRGCPFSCIYCLAPDVAGKKVRGRSAAHVVAELRECVGRHGIRNFLFRSDLFTANKKWVLELCAAVREARLDIQWACNSRVDTIDEELLQAMQSAGCWVIAFGVESGSDEMLQQMKKGATVADARQAIRACRTVGVKSSVYFLIGLPWETEETFRQTVDFAKELSPDFVEFFYAYPFEGTEYYETAVAHGLLERGEHPHEAYSAPAIPSLHFTKEELIGLRNRALREFYLRPRFIARTLWQARSPRVMLNYARYGFKQLTALMG